MKENILKIIHGDPQMEPIVLLASKYEALTDREQQREFLSVIKQLSVDGIEKEKFAALTIIEFLDKAKECEDVIMLNIDGFDFGQNPKLISPLLWLCASLSTQPAIEYIKKTIGYFIDKKEFSYHLTIGLRSIVCTNYWEGSIQEIIWALENFDNKYVVDFFAFFKYKNDTDNLARLYQHIKSQDQLHKKILYLSAEIEKRYKDNYSKLSK